MYVVLHFWIYPEILYIFANKTIHAFPYIATKSICYLWFFIFDYTIGLHPDQVSRKEFIYCIKVYVMEF